MFALPLAVIGAFIGLAASGNTLNLLSMIGVIVLMGLVGKNGILLVDFTNTLRQRGIARTDALREAGETRLRPILMTTVALVVGLCPLVLGLEEGSEIYKGMAAVIIGGMLSSTVLSLLVVPCMYTYFDDLDLCIRALRAGWETWHVPESRIIHIAGATTGITARQAPKRVPDYWFQARRRYYLKNFGKLAAALTDLAFLAGVEVLAAGEEAVDGRNGDAKNDVA